jgi:hypothetical protein
VWERERERERERETSFGEKRTNFHIWKFTVANLIENLYFKGSGRGKKYPIKAKCMYAMKSWYLLYLAIISPFWSSTYVSTINIYIKGISVAHWSNFSLFSFSLSFPLALFNKNNFLRK